MNGPGSDKIPAGAAIAIIGGAIAGILLVRWLTRETSGVAG